MTVQELVKLLLRFDGSEEVVMEGEEIVAVHSQRVKGKVVVTLKGEE